MALSINCWVHLAYPLWTLFFFQVRSDGPSIGPKSTHFVLGHARCIQQYCWCTQQFSEWTIFPLTWKFKKCPAPSLPHLFGFFLFFFCSFFFSAPSCCTFLLFSLIRNFLSFLFLLPFLLSPILWLGIFFLFFLLSLWLEIFLLSFSFFFCFRG